MSLINDALKKAQKQRTGEAPSLASMPSVGGESAQRIARRAKPAGFNTLLVRAGIGGAVVLVVSLGAFFALREKPEDRGQTTAAAQSPAVGSPLAGGPSPTPAQSLQPQVSGLSPQVSAPPVAAPHFTLPVAPKTEGSVAVVADPGPVSPRPATTAIVAKPEPPRQSAQNPASNPQVSGLKSQVSVPSPAPASPPAKLEPRAIQFIENIKVAGIRASATDSKVLMNDRVYRLGDTVEHEMGLKLTGITSSSLTFEDERGARYTRTF